MAWIDVESRPDAFCAAFLDAVPKPTRLAARPRSSNFCGPVLQAENGRWILDYVRLRFRATLPATR